MINLIDNIFGPILGWLNQAYSYLVHLSVPLSRPLNLSNYFSVFAFLGPAWTTVITTSITLTVLYLVVMVIVRNIDAIIKFIQLIKFW